MTVTPEQIIDSLLEIATGQNEQLYEHKDINADGYNQQIQEVYEQYQAMKQ